MDTDETEHGMSKILYAAMRPRAGDNVSAQLRAYWEALCALHGLRITLDEPSREYIDSGDHELAEFLLNDRNVRFVLKVDFRRIDIVPGRYEVSAGISKPSEGIELIVHRFERCP